MCLILLSLFNFWIQEHIDQKILDLTFNGHHLQAEKLINEEIRKRPEHPKYYFFHAANNFQRQLSIQGSKQREDSIAMEIESYANLSIEKAEDMVESTETQFWLGASYGYLGRAQAARGSWLKAYWNGKKGKNFLEEVVEKDPKFYDAYLGLGIFLYYADILPGFVKAIAWLLGVSGDREKGLQYIHLAQINGHYSFGEANIFLCMIYRDLELDYDKCLEYANQHLKQYPESSIALQFQLSSYFELLQYKNVEKLINADKKNQFSPFTRARIEFYKFNYSVADSIFNDLISKNSTTINLKYWHCINRWLNDKNMIYLNDILKVDNYKTYFLVKMMQEKKVNDTDAIFYFSLRKKICYQEIDISEVENNYTSMKESPFKYLLALNLAQYYMNQKNFLKAEYYYSNSIMNKELWNGRTFLNLIKIYTSETVPKKKVLDLAKLIDEFEEKNDTKIISYMAKKMYKKYNL